MKPSTSSYSARLLRQYRSLAKKLDFLIESGEMNALSQEKRKQLTNRFKALYKRLKEVCSLHTLKRGISAALLLLGFGASTEVHAQAFMPQVINPFGLDSTYGFAFPTMADLDADGDLDMLVGEYYGNLQYFENTGTSTAPVFAAPVMNPFGLTSGYFFLAPTLGDIDGDGDYDILSGDYYGVMKYQENIGTDSIPAFGPVVENPFGLDSTYYLAFPEFVDLDADGDLDLMVGEQYGTFQYFENIGNDTMPAFDAPVANAFGLTSAYYFGVPAFADLDMDGDLDMMAYEYYSNFQYYENIGNDSMPSFAGPLKNPFGLDSTAGYLSGLQFADIDGDGDQDLFAGGYYGAIVYFENNDSLITALPTLLNEEEVSLFPNPTHAHLTVAYTTTTVDKEVRVTVYDLTGRKWMEKQESISGNQFNYEIDLSDFPRGIGLLEIRNGENRAVRRFMKR